MVGKVRRRGTSAIFWDFAVSSRVFQPYTLPEVLHRWERGMLGRQAVARFVGAGDAESARGQLGIWLSYLDGVRTIGG